MWVILSPSPDTTDLNNHSLPHRGMYSLFSTCLSLVCLSPVHSGACGAAELCEPSAGGSALQRGLAAQSDRAAGAGEDGDAAAAATPAALGKRTGYTGN